ncbi:MAG: B12-binding domain-containing radical SAM protein [Anaerolineales bacterium]|nr:B12-binding domain-containing radical SAM protein [Anaerolineales bacterium]
MKVKFILPALTEAHGRYWRPIKYSLFPPLGLATLAGYLEDSDCSEIVDEHVDKVGTDDDPDLAAIETYITSSYRAYRIADAYRERGVYVVMGGLHVTACPDEALLHADTIVLGPAEEAWPRFLADFRVGTPDRVYKSRIRELSSLPPLRRDLIKRKNYLVPNSISVSRGCPHRCGFCYVNSFFDGGKRFYTYPVQKALAEIQTMPGRHLFFLDDNIFGDVGFAADLFKGMANLGRVWQGAATVRSILNTQLLDLAVQSSLRSLFIGFESLNQESMRRYHKDHNKVEMYNDAIELLHQRGVMINASFVYGFDGDDESVFDATVDWAISQGIETATFHILTPYPGTALYREYAASGRILHNNWDLYDTRHAVFTHPRMSPETLEQGYWRSYKRFYQWSNITRSALVKPGVMDTLRHIAYVGGWKKFDPLWGLLIRLRRIDVAIPMLERVLKGRNVVSGEPFRQKQIGDVTDINPHVL